MYGADGDVAADRGPSRVVALPSDAGSPLQVLVTNDGVSSGLLTLSCRADLPEPKPLPDVDLNPIPDPATGAEGPVETLPEPPGPKPAGVDMPPVMDVTPTIEGFDEPTEDQAPAPDTD